MFELAQGSRGILPEAEKDPYDRVIELLRCAQPTESDPSKFIRLSSESFPDLRGPQLELLSDVCLAAHHSEEFFLSLAANQWVRTSITCDVPPSKLFSAKSIVEERAKRISSITIHSNVLPLDPFWTRVQTIRSDGASHRVHFPCSILKEALNEESTLMRKLLEWRDRRVECEIFSRRSDHVSKKLFWAIGAGERDDVKSLKHFDLDRSIWLVTWRGGRFVRKDSPGRDSQNEDRSGPASSDSQSRPRDSFEKELDVMERLSHPHIVYGFGVSHAVNKRSLFMEYMEGDLHQLIEDIVRSRPRDEALLKPPFLDLEAVDILLQFAKGMDHIHKQRVVHGDLKSGNVLISKVSISDDVCPYLVKVADFNSAQLVSSNYSSTGFKPADGTTKYAAPEVLEFRNSKDKLTFHPYEIDVYSFGIVAFEVLTGEALYEDISHKTTEMKRRITQEELRPPLRAKCQKDNFLNNEKLIKLIESCWDGEPRKRPSFARIVKVLDSVREQILEAQASLSNHPPRPANLSPTDSAGAHEEAATRSNGHHPSLPVQPNNTSVAVHGQVRQSSRRWNGLKKLLRHFSCVSGGDVQN